MTDPDKWAEMILRKELKSLRTDYEHLIVSTKGVPIDEQKAATKRVKGCMLSVENLLKYVVKLNMNLTKEKNDNS